MKHSDITGEMRHTKGAWSWVPTLFAVEEIPAAIVTYVALLMFVQTKTPPELATLCCGGLALPWVLKSFLRERVRRAGHFRNVLLWLELAMVVAISFLAFVFPRHSNLSLWLFLWLFVISFLTAWHELAARMYYERKLFPEEQQMYNSPKVFFSQSAVVLTYGAMIMLVGALQVIYRSIIRGWNTACYMIAGVMLLVTLYHVFVLRRPQVGDSRHRGTAFDAVLAEMHVIDRVRRKKYSRFAVVGMFLLLLPQSLMFFTRVLFLMTSAENGGLGCSIQEIGFAQGTVGVIAFTVGIAMSRKLTSLYGMQVMFKWMVFAIGLSPLSYVLMSWLCPESLGLICIGTFFAQWCFGFGLHACMRIVRYVSGERYRNTINYLYVPIVAAVMLVPMCMSGWLLGVMGFKAFFCLDAFTSVVAWVFFLIKRNETICLDTNPVLR